MSIGGERRSRPALRELRIEMCVTKDQKGAGPSCSVEKWSFAI